MFYFINENTKIDLGKVSVIDKRFNIITGERGLFIRVDGKEFQIEKVRDFMSTFEAYTKQEALNKQYTTI